MTSRTVTLTDNSTGKSIEMPVVEGSIGPAVIDIRKLYAETGMFTFDPGYTSTGSCESKITYIDGDQGVLLHRGYPIEQLAEHSSYLEVCFLLFYGHLPTEAELKDRRILGVEGFVTIFAVVSSADGTVLAGPQIHARGVAEEDAVFDEVLPEVSAALLAAVVGGTTDTHQLQQVVRRVVGRWVSARLGRRPMIIAVIVEA